eukprot:3065300-Amphidinium_carterae.1
MATTSALQCFLARLPGGIKDGASGGATTLVGDELAGQREMMEREPMGATASRACTYACCKAACMCLCKCLCGLIVGVCAGVCAVVCGVLFVSLTVVSLPVFAAE